MYPWTHFIFGGFLGSIFYYLDIIPLEAVLIVAILSTLVDLDHYISYFVNKHEFSLKKIWNECVLGHYHGRSFIHRSDGFTIITLLLAGLYFISYYWFLIIALAYYGHYLLDHLHIKMKRGLNINKFGFHLHIFYIELAIAVVTKGLTIFFLMGGYFL